MNKKENDTGKGQSNFRLVMKRLMKNPNAVAGMVILAVILAVGLFTEVIAPYGYAEINMADRLQGPSLRHFFGTDEMGRDLFSRIIYGTRSTLMISFGTVAFGTGIGIILGSAAGYFGGRADNIITVSYTHLDVYKRQ